MNCPNCNTPNDAANQFCLKCGYSLQTPPAVAASPAPNGLLLHTSRLVVMLLGLWLMRGILTALPFVKELRFNDFPLLPVEIIRILVDLIIIGLLIAFAANLNRTWAATFPRTPEAGGMITALIYIIVLSVLYSGLAPILSATFNATEPLLVLRIFFVILALILAARILVRLYYALPRWLTGLREWLVEPDHR